MIRSKLNEKNSQPPDVTAIDRANGLIARESKVFRRSGIGRTIGRERDLPM